LAVKVKEGRERRISEGGGSKTKVKREDILTVHEGKLISKKESS